VADKAVLSKVNTKTYLLSIIIILILSMKKERTTREDQLIKLHGHPVESYAY
jgi:hypothetical protein